MRVAGLWRFPVKSMQGESLEHAEIDELGIVGDRQWALVDTETGLALTARRVPELLFASARLVGESDGVACQVEVTLPDGRQTNDDEALSNWLGRSVELRRAGPDVSGRYEIAVDFEDESTSPWVQWEGPQGTFHDSTQTRVSIMSTASMRQWVLRRFRTNVVVEADHDGDEDTLVGQHVTIGSVVLEIVKQIDRCVMTTRPQPGGIERDLDVLRTINADRASFLGVSAMVIRPGAVAIGDDLRVGA